MYRRSATRLQNEPLTAIRLWLDSFDTVLSDCDGVLWQHNDPIAGSAQVLDMLRDSGKQVFLVTNNSTKTRAEIRQKALQMGIQVEEDFIVCPPNTAARYLNSQRITGQVYVIGEPCIGRELDSAGIRHIGIGPDVMTSSLHGLIQEVARETSNVAAVIVGFDRHFSYPKMLRVSEYLKRSDCRFFATNTDDLLMLPGGITVPEGGPIVSAVSAASRRPYELLGKPSRLAYDALVEHHGIVAERTLMIGDRCDTDILFGSNCGFQTLLVGSGVNSMEDVDKFRCLGEANLVPDAFLDTLGALGEILSRL